MFLARQFYELFDTDGGTAAGIVFTIAISIAGGCLGYKVSSTPDTFFMWTCFTCAGVMVLYFIGRSQDENR